VQGVGFRVTTRGIARRHPVTGWVRNEADGSVCLEVQGTAPEVEGFLDELRRSMEGLIAGETSAKVAPEPGEQSFEVRR